MSRVQHVRNWLLRKLAFNGRGAAAIEFALIAVPMVLLILGSFQIILLSAAKLSLDMAVQNLAYDAAKRDVAAMDTVLTRSNFCSLSSFNLVDCESDTELCFQIIPLDSNGVLQDPVFECQIKTALPSMKNCCYEIIVNYPVPAAFDFWVLLAAFDGASHQTRYLQSVAFVYRS